MEWSRYRSPPTITGYYHCDMGAGYVSLRRGGGAWGGGSNADLSQ